MTAEKRESFVTRRKSNSRSHHVAVGMLLLTSEEDPEEDIQSTYLETDTRSTDVSCHRMGNGFSGVLSKTGSDVTSGENHVYALPTSTDAGQHKCLI